MKTLFRLFFALTMMPVLFIAGCQKVVDQSGNSQTATSNAGNILIDPTIQPVTFPIQYKGMVHLSIARRNMAAAGAGNRILFAGGHTAFGIVSTVDIFDATTFTRTTAQLSQARSGIGAGALGNKIFFAGGRTTDGLPSKRVDIYDVATNSWSTAELSVARAHVAVAAAGNKVMFAGGVDVNLDPYPYHYPIIDKYDVVTGSWSATYGAREATVGASTGNVIGFAGWNSLLEKSQARLYNAATNTWWTKDLGDHGAENGGMAVAGAADKLLFGMGGGAYSLSKLFDIYSASSNSWFSYQLSVPRHNVGTCSYGNYAFFVGGHKGEEAEYDRLPFISDRIDIYNASLNKWYLRRLHIPNASLNCAAANNTLMFAGGWNNTAEFFHDVQIYKITGEPLFPAP